MEGLEDSRGRAVGGVRVMRVVHVEVRGRRRRQPTLDAVEARRACVAGNDAGSFSSALWRSLSLPALRW